MKIAAIGECMIELTGSGSEYRLGYAGDTFNTAVYLKRLLGDRGQVRYVTATGDDALSDSLVAAITEERIIPDLVRVAGASPALYIVSTDEHGERSFTYYRDASPMRALFVDACDEAIAGRLLGVDLIYLSAITLQMLSDAARARLLSLLDRARSGGTRVAFDSNFRHRGWPSRADARVAIEAVMRRTDIALPSLDDERALRGSTDAEAVIEAYERAGVSEVVVKDGANPVVVSGEEGVRRIPTTPVTRAVDTTGAGDSFNAGYLAARLFGATAADGVLSAQCLAARVIASPGAIIPLASWRASSGDLPGH